MFIETLWPDFDGEDLRRAVEAFRGRERRYGGLAPDKGDPSGVLTPAALKPALSPQAR